MSRDKELEQGFLSRWSRRKLERDADAAAVADQQPAAAEPARSDLPAGEAGANEEKPVWQRDDVDAETRKEALRALFRKPEFNIRDGLNEYDDDFTRFSSLGDVVTHEMKRMLKLAEQQSRPQTAQAEQAEQKPATDDSNAKKEDDGSA